MLFKAGFVAVVVILNNISASAGRSLISRQSSTVTSIPGCPQCTTFSNDLQPCSSSSEDEVNCLCKTSHLQDLADCISCAPDPSEVTNSISPNMSPAQVLSFLVEECQVHGFAVSAPTLTSAQIKPSTTSSSAAAALAQSTSAGTAPAALSELASPPSSSSPTPSVSSGSPSSSSNNTQTAAVMSSNVASPSVTAQPNAAKASRSVYNLPLLGLVGAVLVFAF